MTLSPEAREEVAPITREMIEAGRKAIADERARVGMQYPDTLAVLVYRAMLSASPAPTASGGLEADRRPNLGAMNGGLEPSIRSILKAYYGAHFSTTEAKRLTDAYLAALAAPATPAGAGGTNWLTHAQEGPHHLSGGATEEDYRNARFAGAALGSMVVGSGPHPAPDTGASVVKVKALEWFDSADRLSSSLYYSVAKTPIGDCWASRTASGEWDAAVGGTKLRDGKGSVALYSTLDEAKAAAEADYETRIRSALEGRADG
ncbi:hypothetical protein BOSEA31B_10428 [Hyphomicrobiales bacterium]|nr:hypothetical protein BOSEA31B_10428 [Hyphomicrobiales bacterium]CAH1702110.1 hypothetical protein BOSEA1005_21809 [Hyphomicrobiales bacterium]CAI0346267.1 hypothetical protein BO1005MUT1_490079 [Hyphomicrobiales bacterium]